jgi:hypothetical protein
MAEVCKIWHELSAKFLMDNEVVTRQISRMSKRIGDIEVMTKMATDKATIRSLNASKAFEEAKLETYMLSRMAAGKNKSLYIDSLLDLYDKTWELTEWVIVVRELQQLIVNGLGDLSDLSILFPDTVAIEESLEKVQAGILQRLAYDYSYATKFWLKKFTDDVTDQKKIKDSARLLAKWRTVEQIIDEYNNNDELFLKIMENTQNGEAWLINYVIARSILNGSLAWDTVPRQLYTNLGLRTMNDDELTNSLNLIRNKLTQNGLDRLQYLFITNLDAFMNSKQLYDKLQSTITRVVLQGSNDADIQMVEAWRTLQRQITFANVDPINRAVAKKIALQRLNSIGKVTEWVYNRLMKLVKNYAANPTGKEDIGSVTIKSAKGKEKSFTRANIWELIGILGVDELINNKIDIDAVLSWGLLNDKRTINYIKNLGNEELLELASAENAEEFLRAIVNYNPTAVKEYLNDIVRLHTQKWDPAKIEAKSTGMYLQNVATDIFDSTDSIFYNRQLDTTLFRWTTTPTPEAAASELPADQTMAFSDLSMSELRNWAIRVAEGIDSYDTLDGVINAVQSSNTITKIVLPNNFRIQDKDRRALDWITNWAGKKVKVVYPLWERAFSFFMEDGNLFHGAVSAQDKKYLSELNTALASNMTYLDNTDNTDLYNQIINMRFGNKAQVVRDYLDINYPNDTLFQKIRRLEYASRINGWINQWIADLQEWWTNIKEYTARDIYNDVRTRLNLEEITLPEDIDIDMLQKVFFNYTYSDTIENKGRALNDLMIMLGYWDGLVANEYHAIAMVWNLMDNWYQVPFVSIQNVVDYFNKQGTKNIDTFLRAFRLKNPTRFTDATSDLWVLATLRRAYESTLFSNKMWDATEWWVDLTDRVVFENLSIDEISKLRSDMALIDPVDLNRPLNIDIETKRVNDIVDAYYNEASAMAQRWATEKEFYDLKRKYQNIIYTYEQQFLVPKYWGYVNNEKSLYTAIFDVVKITNTDQLPVLRQQLDNIKDAHRQQIESVIDAQSKIKTKEYTKAEIIDQLSNKGYYFTNDGINMVKVTIDDLLYKWLSDMTDSIWSLSRLKDVEWANMSNAEKVKRWRVIDAANKTRNNVVDAADALYERLFWITQWSMLNYTVKNVDGIGEMPYILSVTNKTSLPYAQDKGIKVLIFRDIGDAFVKNNQLTETQLREIVKRHTNTEEARGFVDQYVKDFKFYTQLQNIPEWLLTEFAKLNSIDDDIAQITDLAGDIMIWTLRWEMKLRDAIAAGPQSVIAKTLPQNVKPTQLPVDQSPEFARRGRNLFYAYNNWLEEIPEVYSQIKSSVFNVANSIVRGTDSPRLNKMADTGFLLSSKAQVVSRLMNVQWWFRFGAWPLNKNYITQQNLGIIQDLYNSVLDLPAKEFDEARARAVYDENFRIAYLIADYFRSLREQLRDLTTNPEINQLIEDLPTLFGNKKRFGVSQLAALGNQIRAYEILEMIEQVDKAKLWPRLATPWWALFRTIDPTLPLGKSGFVDEEWLRRFNTMFDSNLSMQDYKYILMAYNRMKLGDYVSRAAAFVNKRVWWTNRPITRAILSFPGSFMSIASSIISYSVSTKAYADFLWENFEWLRRSRTIRQWLGILVGEGSDATDLVKLNPSSTTPSLLDLYKAYTMSYGAAAERVLAPAIDNFHNWVDAAFAWLVKEVAFISALRSNRWPLRFMSADDFDAWLKSNPDEVLKKRVVDSVTAKAYEIYRADTGMHPTAAEQPQMAGLMWVLLPLFNFRGARWLMMLRDTAEVFSNSWQMMQYIYRNWWSPATRANLETWLISNPKFTRFFETIFTAGYYAVKVEKALNGQDPVEERESDFVKNVVEVFSQMSMRWAWLESNALTRVLWLNLNAMLGNTPQGLIWGTIYWYRTAEDFEANKIQWAIWWGAMGAIQQMQNSLLSQLRFIEPSRRLMSAYINNWWDGFLTEADSVFTNISTGMARYNLDVLQLARGSDYLPRDRSPNYAIFWLNNTANQSLRNELVLREKLAKYFLGTQNYRAQYLEKGDRWYTWENMKNSFFWSEIANTWPVWRLVDAYLWGRLWTYMPDQTSLLEGIYAEDPFVRSFLFDNKLDIDLIQSDKIEQSIDTIWFWTANFWVGKDSGNVRPADIIRSFIANKYDEPDLYLMSNDNIALDAIPEKTLRDIMALDNTAIDESQRNQAWIDLINALNNVPEEKKAFTSGIFLKIYMNREYDRKEAEYKEQIKQINKNRPKGDKLTTTVPTNTQLQFKYDIVKSIQDRLVDVDRPWAQNIVNNIMAINHADQLKEAGLLKSIVYSNWDVRYTFQDWWDDYLGNVARLTTMVASWEPDAYLKTQSYFNNIGKYSGPDVQLAMLHRIRQFIDDREMDTTDKISWKAGILEANRKLLFTKTDELRKKLGDDSVDAAIRYYYEFDDQLRDYTMDVYNKEKATGDWGTGWRKPRINLPNFKAHMLPERPKGDARVAKWIPAISYHKTPGQLSRENPTPGPVSDMRWSAISKPLFTTSEKVKDITRRLTKASVESFKFKKEK